MKHLNLSMADCKNCYKCLRSCSVKAIRFKNQQAEIVEDRCISCSHCLEICPQNARHVESDLEEIKKVLSSGKKVVISLAPSFAGTLDMNYKKLIGVLKKLGFSNVEETAIGAKVVSNLYMDYIEKNEQPNYISTACPSSMFLIEKYYPNLIKYLIPVVSPMIAHGKLIRQVYGDDCFIVFIGPCFSKKIEAEDLFNKEVINAVLTFQELELWIEEEHINLNSIEESDFDGNVCYASRDYAIEGGIIENIKPALTKKNLNIISVSSVDDSIELLKNMDEGFIQNSFVEINSCKGSCIGGPSMIRETGSYYKKLNKIKDYISSKPNNCTSENQEVQINNDIFIKQFENKSIEKPSISEDDIKQILMDMGKFKKEDELNCGVCGYNTCRDKAIAIYEGMAETTMCLNYMRNKAESVRNVIFENTLNCIILLDGNLIIKDINPATENAFSIRRENIIDKPLSFIIDDEEFSMLKKESNIVNRKISCPKYNLDFIATAVYIKDQDIIMVALLNVTDQEKDKKRIMNLKENTLQAAHKVIEKQMMVAQEIASLLGETTAETKITLTKLKKIVEEENDLI